MAGERKTKYHSHVEPKLLLIEAWARDGLVDEDIAKKIGVGYSTFKLYKTQHLALLDALKKGKEVADIEVENALFKRAVGYQYDEVTQERVTMRNEETGEIESVLIETKRVTKEVQPDTTAQIFWLKNRKPVEWRDKQEVEHSGKMQHEVALEGLSDDELRERIAAEVAAINHLQTRTTAPDKG